MNWHAFASYAVGFFLIPVLVSWIVFAIGAVAVSAEWLVEQHLSGTNFWTGFWLAIGLSVVATTIVMRWIVAS